MPYLKNKKNYFSESLYYGRIRNLNIIFCYVNQKAVRDLKSYKKTVIW